MPDIYMDVDTALSEVPVNVMPLIDDTDFKTRETAVAYNAAGMDLVWNFVTTGGAFTQTAVTPTTAGTYDWTHQGDGMYTIEIPASGGASINNDTEGFGWFTGLATGVLPWRGPVIGFRASGLNDALIDSAYSTTRGLAGTALPNAAAEATGGLYTRGTGAGQINQAANGQVDTNVTHAAGTAWASGAITAAVIATGAIDADAIADNAIDAGAIAADAITAAKIADGAIDAGTFAAGAITASAIAADAIGASELAADAITEIQSGLATASALATVAGYIDTEIAAIISTLGTPAGASVSADIAAVKSDTAATLVDTNELQTDWVNGGRLDLILDARASQTSVDTIDGIVDAILVDTGTDIPATLATIAAYIDTEIAAIKAKTDQLTFTTANRVDSQVYGMQADTITAAATATDFGTEIGTAVWATTTRTLSALDEDSTTIDLDATIRGAIGMAEANLDGILGGIVTTLGIPALSISDDIAAVKSDTGGLEITIGSAGAGLTAIPWNAAWDAEVQSEAADALIAYDPPTKAELDSAVAPLATSADLATVAGYIDTEVAAIKAKTDNLPTDPADASVIAARFDTLDTSVADLPTNAELATALDAIPTAIENADALLNRDMATGTDSGSTTVRTVRQALRLNRNKVEISGGTMTVYKEDDSTTSWTSAITTDGAAEPITASDPAGP